MLPSNTKQELVFFKKAGGAGSIFNRMKLHRNKIKDNRKQKLGNSASAVFLKTEKDFLLVHIKRTKREK